MKASGRGVLTAASGTGHRVLPFFVIFLWALTGCSSSPTQGSSSRHAIPVSGTLRSGTLPLPKTAIYLTDLSRPGRSFEKATDLQGHFRMDLAPGTWRLESGPISSCPVDNTFVVPEGSPPLKVRVTAPALTFIHCPPSRLELSGSVSARQEASVASPAIRGFLIPPPGQTVPLFMTPAGTGGKVDELSVKENGTFTWSPSGPGRYTVQSVLTGFCPIYATILIRRDSRYLVVSSHRLDKGRQCPSVTTNVYSGAFSLPPGSR
ncbi:MAG: hypothetical protein ACYCRD_09800 [Leptospirillum sp.]